MRAFWRLLGIWAVLAALLPNPAAAQISGGVQQKGTVTANNCAKWAGPGVIQDSGSTCGGGGSGSPGGSPTQVQYNAAGSFGGISGATSDGTTITLVAPILGTPASVTLTNGTGLPIGGTTGWGTGVAAALANPINATSGFATYVLGSSSAFGLVKVDNTTITASAGVITAVNTGTVTSVSAGCGTSTGGSPITTTGTVLAALSERVNTSASDPIVAADCGGIVYENSASSVAASLAQAGTTGFATATFFGVCNINAGVVTITPTTSTIGGASTLVVNAGTAAHPTCVGFKSDGTNYKLTEPPLGSGVAAALGNALSAAGGLTSTIASGTSALGTGAISSATCATVVTTTATNTATTDVVLASFNGDPTAVTGYIPATAGMLTIIAYPTSGNVNFKVCNNTSSSVTPGAITLNWRVVR